MKVFLPEFSDKLSGDHEACCNEGNIASEGIAVFLIMRGNKAGCKAYRHTYSHNRSIRVYTFPESDCQHTRKLHQYRCNKKHRQEPQRCQAVRTDKRLSCSPEDIYKILEAELRVDAAPEREREQYSPEFLVKKCYPAFL